MSILHFVLESILKFVTTFGLTGQLEARLVAHLNNSTRKFVTAFKILLLNSTTKSPQSSSTSALSAYSGAWTLSELTWNLHCIGKQWPLTLLAIPTSRSIVTAFFLYSYKENLLICASKYLKNWKLIYIVNLNTEKTGLFGQQKIVGGWKTSKLFYVPKKL